MSRNFDDWIGNFLQYCQGGESPRHVNFWVAVATIAGCLRRRVWLDMRRFVWYPNFYIILVAPPAVVQKSTSSDQGMRLLRQVPGIVFGPHVTTWESLVVRFAQAAEQFEWNGNSYTQSPLMLDSGEFGNLFDPKDRKQVDLFVRLYDCPPGRFEKETKMSGNDTIYDACVNLIACTTPAWIMDNFPTYLIGGGFTSRCIFVYVDEKATEIAWPDEHVVRNHAEMAQLLVQDLEHISLLAGEFQLSIEAREWGREWYHQHLTEDMKRMHGPMLMGYAGRKQSHMVKLSMILSASRSDDLIISIDDIQTAAAMLTDLEPDMQKVFSNIGLSERSGNVDKMLQYVKKKGRVPYKEVYSQVYMYFPSGKEFEEVFRGAIQSGILSIKTEGGVTYVLPGPNMH